jgi:solute carrier family 39 (zinc transporter), member 1/2/3
MILFAITTPVGILAGLLTFTRDTDRGKSLVSFEEYICHLLNAYFNIGQMKFTQGLMCAISAGMLIYAACVEMLAGDFVMDTTLWRSPIWKQAVALTSLLIGATAMAVIG